VQDQRSAPVLAYVLGGVAAFALGSFSYFAIAGKTLEKNRARTCSPSCTDDQVAPVRRDYAIADVSLGVGVIAAGLATWLFLRARSAPRASASLGTFIVVEPFARGGALRLGSAF
jgi:hypothetical protein